MITRLTEGQKLQIKCHMDYNVSLVQPGDREEKGKFSRDKEEEKNRWRIARQDRQNPDPLLVSSIILSALYKSVKFLFESQQLMVPQLEY